MKKLVAAIWVLFALCVDADAQGTFQFTIHLNGSSMVPPNGSTLTGDGMLTLEGTALSYDFSGARVAGGGYPDTAEIRGPALSGNNAGFLYGLGRPLIETPFPPSLGSYVYRGTIAITDQQRSELLSGLWYILVTTQENPLGEIRGQIVPVPEPGTAGLVLVGGLLWTARLMRFRRR